MWDTQLDKLERFMEKKIKLNQNQEITIYSDSVDFSLSIKVDKNSITIMKHKDGFTEKIQLGDNKNENQSK